MSREENSYDGPSNAVERNRYVSESELRVQAELVQEQGWYTARLRDQDSRTADRYARDILMRVLKVVNVKGGARKIYAVPIGHDGPGGTDEDNSALMAADGFFNEGGFEWGYLPDAFKRDPRNIGALMATTTVERKPSGLTLVGDIVPKESQPTEVAV